MEPCTLTCCAAIGCVLLLLLLTIIYTAIIRNINPSDKLQYTGGHLIVAGGSSGIGLSLSRRLRREGASVTLVARDVAKLQAAQKQLLAEPSPSKEAGVHILALDLARGDAGEIGDVLIAHLATVAMPLLGVVNCVGVAEPNEFEQLSFEQHERMMQVNYLSTIRLLHKLLPELKSANRASRIALISSVAGQLGVYGYTGYGAAKFALRGLAESLQMELCRSQCRIVLAFPPDTDTPGFASENASKPKETSLISGKLQLWQPDSIAKQLIVDIADGRFFSSFGTDGWLVSCVTAGFSPPTGFCDTLAQILLNGVFRLIGLCYLYSMYDTVRKCVINGDGDDRKKK